MLKDAQAADSFNPEEEGLVGEDEKKEEDREKDTEPVDTFMEEVFDVAYSLDDTPPWPLCFLLGLQHYLTAFGSTLSVPLILAGPLCLGGDNVGLSEVIGTIFFVSGIATLLQTTLGIRLPIIQGATFAFLAPTFSILSLPKWQCPSRVHVTADNTSAAINNNSIANISIAHSYELLAIVENGTTFYAELGGEQHRQIWHARLREIQGAIMVASLSQIILGFTGLFSVVLRYIGPLVVAPTVALVGLTLFEATANKSSAMWWIALATLALVVVFSQCLNTVQVPLPKVTVTCTPKPGFTISTMRLPLFGLFPVLLAMILSWVLCLFLTVTNALPSDPDSWGYYARTDAKSEALQEAPWIRVPYPGQWGVPTVSVSAVLGMLAGVLASMIESVGDYYACARLSGAPPPPSHALNRGVGIEGISCVIAGAFGSGNGTTSYSENVAAIGITKVASRRVVQTAGVLLLLLGCLGKVGALFVTIPDPVVGGIFLAMFGMITAVGLSNVRYVDLRKPRNLCVLGLSLFMGLCVPRWVSANKSSIDSGSFIVDQIIEVLMSTGMFVGGTIGFVLDNLLPGTDEERGLTKWREESAYTGGEKGGGEGRGSGVEAYTIPYIYSCIDRLPLLGRLSFCPPARRRTSFAHTTHTGSQPLKPRVCFDGDVQPLKPTFGRHDTNSDHHGSGHSEDQLQASMV